jgi:hypothetical protein
LLSYADMSFADSGRSPQRLTSRCRCPDCTTTAPDAGSTPPNTCRT